VAFVVQQFAWPSVPLALPHFATSRYVADEQTVRVPQHVVVSGSQHVPPKRAVATTLQLAASDRHFVVPTFALILVPAGHLAELQVAFAVQQFACQSDPLAEAPLGYLVRSRQIPTVPKHEAVSVAQHVPPKRAVATTLQLAALDRHFVVPTFALILVPDGHVAELQVAFAVQQLVCQSACAAPAVLNCLMESLYLPELQVNDFPRQTGAVESSQHDCGRQEDAAVEHRVLEVPVLLVVPAGQADMTPGACKRAISVRSWCFLHIIFTPAGV